MVGRCLPPNGKKTTLRIGRLRRERNPPMLLVIVNQDQKIELLVSNIDDDRHAPSTHRLAQGYDRDGTHVLARGRDGELEEDQRWNHSW
jgi:hypothetical protein